jgi:uncharacterized protein (DUF305 family)
MAAAERLHGTLRRACLALGLGALLLPAGRSAAATEGKENSKMATDTSGRKEPPPPPSTLAFGEHVGRLPLYVSVVYTHQPDRDFASLLAGQRRGLYELAQIELKYGTDPEMRAIAQRIVEAYPTEDAALTAWRKRKGSS